MAWCSTLRCISDRCSRCFTIFDMKSRMLLAWIRSLSGGEADQDSLLAWWVIIGTLPAVAVGFLFQHRIEK